ADRAADKRRRPAGRSPGRRGRRDAVHGACEAGRGRRADGLLHAGRRETCVSSSARAASARAATSPALTPRSVGPGTHFIPPSPRRRRAHSLPTVTAFRSGWLTPGPGSRSRCAGFAAGAHSPCFLVIGVMLPTWPAAGLGTGSVRLVCCSGTELCGSLHARGPGTGTLRRGCGYLLLGGVGAGVLEVWGFPLAAAQLAHLLHLRLQLRRRLFALTFACRLFRGEIQGHGVGPPLVSHRHTADDVRAECGPLVGGLRHELPCAFRVAAAALHHLHEARLIWIAVNVDGDVTAVTERDLSREQLGGLHPPLALLTPVTVAPGRLFRLEASQRDEPAILGHPGGHSKPARRTGR